MKTKKAIKKIAALAGSALMVASTVGAGLAAVKDLPTPFVDSEGVFDAYVVVGESAGITDLIGAVEVAAAFAQNAKISAGEGSVIEKNVTPGILETVDGEEMLYFGTKPESESWDSTIDGFSWLLNETVEYNDTDYDITAYLKSSESMAKLNEYGTFAWKADDGVMYNITATNLSFPVGFDQFDFLGERYQIVTISDGSPDTMALGQIEEVTMTLEEETEVGGIATIIATDIDEIHARIRIVVKDNDGNELSNELYSENDIYNNDTLGLKFTVDSFYKSAITGISEVTLNWETSSLEFEDGGAYDPVLNRAYDSAPSSGEKNWTVHLDVDGNDKFVSLELLSWGEYTAEDNFPKEGFVSGEQVELLGGYFSITYDGIYLADASDDEPGDLTTITVMEDIDNGDESGSAPEILFKDSEGDSVNIDISSLLLEPDENYRTEVTYSFDENLIYYQLGDYNGTHTNLTVYDYDSSLALIDTSGDYSGNFTFNLTNDDVGEIYFLVKWDQTNTAKDTPVNVSVVNFTANGEFFEDNLTYVVSGDLGTFTFTEPTGHTIVAKYNVTDKEFDDDPYYLATSSEEFGEGDDFMYSQWGSIYEYAENALNIEYPETRRYAKIVVGRSTTETETVAVGDEIPDSDWTLKAGGGDLIKAFEPKFAYKDTEKATPDKPVILIGGPAINALVSGMGNNTWTLSDWREEVNETRTKTHRAIIDLVEDAFSTYDALVIAGYEAVDTRIAARLLAKELMYGGTILEDVATDRAVLDTTDADGSAESYTAATLVE